MGRVIEMIQGVTYIPNDGNNNNYPHPHLTLHLAGCFIFPNTL